MMICKKCGKELENDAKIFKKWTGNYYLKEDTTKKEYKGQAFPPFMQKIIDCEGLVNYINQKEK